MTARLPDQLQSAIATIEDHVIASLSDYGPLNFFDACRETGLDRHLALAIFLRLIRAQRFSFTHGRYAVIGKEKT